MKGNLDAILSFTKLLQQFRKIERRVLVNNSARKENDIEHSYSLAMIAWYINATYELNLDIKKVLQYALIHDLVEVYAGDVWFYENDQQILNNKKENEEIAAEKIASEYSEFSDLHKIIKDYEERKDFESRFIYALDKVEPILNIYLDQGRTWKAENITLKQLEILKAPKVAIDPTIDQIFKDLIQKLKNEESDLFDIV